MSTATHPSLLHPGTVLAEDFLRPMRISPLRLARDIGLSHAQVTQILQGKRPISAEVALRLGRYLGTPAGFWMSLQSRYDLALAAESAELDAVQPLEIIAGY